MNKVISLISYTNTNKAYNNDRGYTQAYVHAVRAHQPKMNINQTDIFGKLETQRLHLTRNN